MRSALWSQPSRLGDTPGNVQQVVSGIQQQEADLHVWPELFLTGYNIGDDVQRLALSTDDEALGPILDACRDHGRHVVVGAPHTPRPGVTFNAAACVDDAGHVTWVHKRALPTFTTFREGLFFGHGGEQETWKTSLGTFGLGICYDLYFPEFHKMQALAGADVLINISASPTVSQRFFETLLPARAVENACFMLYTNNIGSQDGIMFWGGAQAYGPRGQSLGQLEPMTDGCLTVDIDLDDLVPAREFRPTIRDSDKEEVARLAD